MRSAMRTAHRIRLAAVVSLGAFALHQLRYLLAFGGSSSQELARQGHGYLADAMPILGVFALSALLATLFRGRHGARLTSGSHLRRTTIFAIALLTIYTTQESLEGLFAAGHPVGPAAILASGGWVALPLALAVGALAALIVRALEGVELAIAERLTPRNLRRPRPGPALRPRSVELGRRPLPLAFGLARRPPPSIPA